MRIKMHSTYGATWFRLLILMTECCIRLWENCN